MSFICGKTARLSRSMNFVFMQLGRANLTCSFLLKLKLNQETFHNMDLGTCRNVPLSMFGIILFCFYSVRNLKSCHVFYFSWFV